MSTFVITIELSEIHSFMDTANILRELADDLHSGRHDIYYKGNCVGFYDVVRP
jgi:hypothetical protein